MAQRNPNNENRKGAIKRWLLEHPWITEVEPQSICTGIIWSRVSFRNSRNGIPEKAKCKYKARYHYEGVNKWLHPTGNYCSHHAGSMLYSTEEEMARTMKWAEENGHVVHVVPEDD